MKIESAQEREAAHFLPVVKRYPVVVVEGLGSRLIDDTGREYIDLLAGWAVCCIGHSHPALVSAIREQAGRLMQTTNIFYTLPQLELIDRLAALTGGAVPHAFLVNSGTEAMDGALKLAHRATGRTGFVSTRGSFHGRSIGALRIIGQVKHREPYADLLPDNPVVPFDDLDAARAVVDGDTAAFIVEPIQGEGGVQVPRDGYLNGLREICDENGALLILDEIQTGIGRTGAMLAREHDGVIPDVITLGKGLGGGFPVAAFVATEAVARSVKLGDHGTTFGGNALACAAANSVLEVVTKEKLASRAASLGARLVERLEKFAGARPDRVETVRGRGLLVGLVLRDPERAATLTLRALERGVMVNVTAGSVVRFFPALNIPEDDLWSGVDTVLELVAGD